MARDRKDRAGVKITRGFAGEIAETVRAFRAGSRPGGDPMAGRRLEATLSHYISETPSQWTKRTWMTLEVWAGPPGAESRTGILFSAYNPYATVAAGKQVMVARVNGHFRLCTAECD